MAALSPAMGMLTGNGAGALPYLSPLAMLLMKHKKKEDGKGEVPSSPTPAPAAPPAAAQVAPATQAPEASQFIGMDRKKLAAMLMQYGSGMNRPFGS